MKTEIEPQVEHNGRVSMRGVALTAWRRYLHTETAMITEIPPRSRLYCLTPVGMGTLQIESLTSYINRLAWTYRVSPRILVVQEIVPHLNHGYPHGQLAAFSRGVAMKINDNGNVASEWSTILEQLTMRDDLHALTLRGWIGDLSSRGHLREKPAWCPACYAQWREQGLPLYQPLVWMIQMVTLCPQHKVRLEDRCPYCLKHQSVISLKTHPGHCTQCNTWLGSPPTFVSSQAVSKETMDWQAWIIDALKELRGACTTSGTLQWERFFTALTNCIEGEDTYRRLAYLTGIPHVTIKQWLKSVRLPSLEIIFEFCYGCNVTPLQIMTGQLTPLKETIRHGTSSRLPRHRRLAVGRVNRERCLELIRAVLEGREEPLGINQIAQRLGHTHRTLLTHFPLECQLLTQQFQQYRRQRRTLREQQVCEEVRQAVITLHTQDIFPSHRRVSALLSNPNLMRMPEASAAWHAIRRDLGIDS
jgi:hypothetical protein